MRRIVIKVGSNVIADKDGKLSEAALTSLVDCIAEAKKQQDEIVLVSSGAVAAGSGWVDLPQKTHAIVRRQVLSSIGQVKLMSTYDALFEARGLQCAQVLATKEDFRDRIHYNNMKACMNALLRDEVVPIVNENDVISISELMFTDNDELSGLMAALINADLLCIITNVQGVLDQSGVVIPTIRANTPIESIPVVATRSSMGRGGMQTKIRVAQDAASLGIASYIIGGVDRMVALSHVLQGNDTGTFFPPTAKKSSVKKWIAFNHQKAGKVYINAGACSALQDENRVTSLLPIGIEKIEGNFKKGDLIEVCASEGTVIAIGLAAYGEEVLQKYIGQKSKRALIHYDYLLVK